MINLFHLIRDITTYKMSILVSKKWWITIKHKFTLKDNQYFINFLKIQKNYSKKIVI